MGNSLGRGGRRRRVLNEEMVAASATHAALRTPGTVERKPAGGPSYSEAARFENHARVTDLIPRRSQTLWLGWVLGMALIGGLVALDYYHDSVAHTAGLPSIPMLRVAAAGSLASWFSALVLMVTSVLCVLIYSLRQHKLSDYRGRYRIWLWAAAACVLLSINEVCSSHKLGAQLASQLTGWTALAEHAIWWLVPAVLIGGSIGVQSARDMWESRLARMAALSAGLAFLVYLTFLLAGGSALGVSLTIASILPPAAALFSKIMLLLSVIAYARFVIIAADGQLPARIGAIQTSSTECPASRSQSSQANERTVQTSTKIIPPAASCFPTDMPQPAHGGTSSTEWIDGSSPETAHKFEDGEDNQPHRNRKLSKSERKRLRKLKAQHRAA